LWTLVTTGKVFSAGTDIIPSNWGTEMPSTTELVRVKEAAELLGVSPNTVRIWGANGKIPEYRHPVNNYRLYKREELEALMAQVYQSADSETTRRRAK